MTQTNWSLDNFTVRVTMESDWHIGTGAGRPGNVDRLVARDSDGLPYIPAKTLTGIWRDACERLASALDEADQGSWNRLVEAVFGSQPNVDKIPDFAPTRARLAVAPARFPENLRRRLNGREAVEFRQALTCVKPGVSIHPRTGTARPDFLRFEEMARAGSKLEARCSVRCDDLNPEQRECVRSFLVAGLRLVERLGGKRRRGVGKCRVEIEGSDLSTGLKWLEEHSLALSLEATPAVEPKNNELTGTSTDNWISVPLRIELRAPLVVGLSVSGNVSESMDFVPGTYLLPFVTQRLNLLGFDCRRMVARGDLIVTPATLELRGMRGLPVPTVFSSEKMTGGFDRRNGVVVNRLRERCEEGKQFKPYREGYVVIDVAGEKPLIAYEKIAFSEFAHNVVEDEVQRPTEDVGGIYTREAIPAGTVLRCELRLSKAASDFLALNNPDWWKELGGDYRFGVSSKDDYGLTEIAPEAPRRLESTPLVPTDGVLVVWLLSDVLLRDERLRPTSDLNVLGAELAGKLGVELKLAEPKEELLASAVRTRRIESWQVNWGLPRPSLCGLQAGSCISFEVVPGDLKPEALRKIELMGIGERRGEGYGQVCFNPPLLAGPLREWDRFKSNNTEDSHAPPISKTDSTYETARQLEMIVWREHVRRAAMRRADDSMVRKRFLGCDSERKSPRMSQLGGLRSVVTRLRPDADRQIVLDWIEHVKNTDNRGEKWPDKLEAAKRLIESQGRVWTALGADVKSFPTLTVDGDEVLRNQLWAEAVRAFVDACIRAHKRAIEKIEPGE